MNLRYQVIIENIRKYRMEENKKMLKHWRNELSKWQSQYGAYCPQ
jgi:hypothetical protein